jgi:hypothetical protein
MFKKGYQNFQAFIKATEFPPTQKWLKNCDFPTYKNHKLCIPCAMGGVWGGSPTPIPPQKLPLAKIGFKL